MRRPAGGGARALAFVTFVAFSGRPSVARADGPVVPTTYTGGASIGDANVETAGDSVGDGADEQRVAALVAAGVAVAGVGVGVPFGVLALDKKSAFDAHPTVDGARRGNEYAVVSDVAFGTAVIAGVTGLVLYLRSREPKPVADAAKPRAAFTFTFTPSVTLHGAGAGALVRF
jgi:hypothetical protein